MQKRLNLLESHPHYLAALGIAEKLRSQGFQTLLAGGCVRDAHLGHTPKDLDLATSARPEDIEHLFPKTLPVGKAFGTMVVVMDGANFEVTTFRKDLPYLDGRHPSGVEFSDAREDAKRRDFTINGLFYEPFEHTTLDFVGGIEDLQARVIRTVGDPRERFQEDHLRLLRAVRFSSQLGFDIDAKTWQAIGEMAPLIARVSNERVLQELMKLLEGKYPILGMERLVRSGLAKFVWPTLAQLHSDKIAWSAFCERARWVRHGVSFFALFVRFSRDKESFYRDFETLKPPRRTLETIRRLVHAQEVLWHRDARRAERVRLWAAPEWAFTIELAAAEAVCAPGGSQRLDQWIAEFLSVCDAKGNLPKAFLSGEDLLEMGYAPGPQLGQTLDDLYSQQLEGRINSAAQAREIAADRLRIKL